MWLVIGGTIGALTVLIAVCLLWLKKNYPCLALDNNEKACALAIKTRPLLAWIHPDSEHGMLVKRLGNLTMISKEKQTEVRKLSSSENKTQLKLALEELNKLTAEMVAIMDTVIGNDPLYGAKLSGKLTRISKKIRQ